MTHAQESNVSAILAGISARGIDITGVIPTPLSHGNVSLTVAGFPLLVVGKRGGVESIGFRARYGYASDVQVAIHADMVAAAHSPKPYVKPQGKRSAVPAVNVSAAQGITEDSQLPGYQLE